MLSLHDDKRSEELQDSDLDNIAGGASETPPPTGDEKDPGGIEPPTEDPNPTGPGPVDPPEGGI